jgi:hypothetical protein
MVYFFFRFRFDFPAFSSAMATACFCGFPAFISVLMFDEMVLRDDPDLSGIPGSVRKR